jgi:tetratricopeptide (TPR) repeat protein
MSDKSMNRLLAVLVFIIPLSVYVLTMAATLSFWDSGEFISVAYILGIPHSPGTPLYVLVGRVFTMLPLPMSIAQRVNFLSVTFSALAVMMAYLIMVRTVRFLYPSLKGGLGRFMTHVGPFVGILFLTFSDTYWRDSTEAEVYSLSAFVMGLCTWLALEWYKNPAGHAVVERVSEGEGGGGRPAVEGMTADEERLERGHARGIVYLIIYLLALGIGFHLGTVLVYGGIFLLFLLVKEKAFGNVELIIFTFGFAVVLADMTLWRSSGATVVGLVVFAVLVAWSTMKGGRFALVATGLLALGISVHLYMYIRSHLDPAIDMVDPQTWRAMYAHLRREQYPPINIFARKASFLFQLRHFGRYFMEQFRMLGDVRIGIINVGRALTAIPIALGLYGIAASYGRERKVWVLNFLNLLINSLGLIIFLNFTANEVRDRDYFYGSAFYFFAIFIGIGVTSLLISLAEHLKSRSREPAAYVVPIGALCIFLSILPAHHNWFTHNRSHYYISRDYGYNILAGLEPGAIIFTYGDNDTYPLWYIQNVEHYRTDVVVANLSLLNTDWYIRQLRDREPKTPITLTDDEIERMRPIALRDGGVAWKNDLMVQHIIQTANWKRPIYFAKTVAPEEWKPYERYLETQGLVMRLTPDKEDRMMSVFMMRRNFEEIFRFRGILTKDWKVDNSLYHEKDLSIIINNYGVGAAELGNALGRQKDYAGAVKWTKIALLFAPRLKPANVMLGTYYFMNGQRSEAVAHYRQMTQVDPLEAEYWMRLAWIYSQDDPDLARRTIDEALAHIPDDRQLYIEGFRYAVRMGLADVAKGYIQRWLERHPDDREMRGVYGDVDSLIRVNAKHPPAGDTGRTGG